MAGTEGSVVRRSVLSSNAGLGAAPDSLSLANVRDAARPIIQRSPRIAVRKLVPPLWTTRTIIQRIGGGRMCAHRVENFGIISLDDGHIDIEDHADIPTPRGLWIVGNARSADE